MSGVREEVHPLLVCSLCILVIDGFLDTTSENSDSRANENSSEMHDTTPDQPSAAAGSFPDYLRSVEESCLPGQISLPKNSPVQFPSSLLPLPTFNISRSCP